MSTEVPAWHWSARCSMAAPDELDAFTLRGNYRVAMPDFASYLSALPALGAVMTTIRQWLGVDRLDRTAKRHAELLAAVPARVNAEALRRQLEQELELVARSAQARMNRKVDWSTAAALVVVALLAGAAVWGLWALGSVAALPVWAQWVSRAVAILVAIFSCLLLAAGFPQLYKSREDD